MDIAVLFDGAGLARLGLERAGHSCTGFELNPVAHCLSQFVGPGNCQLADVRDVDLSRFGGVWASPPCQIRSDARTQGAPISPYSGDFLEWSLKIPEHYPNIKTLWVENVYSGGAGNDWGTLYNAAQFLPEPIQNRNRIVGGDHPAPRIYHAYKKKFPYCCPCITATEYKGCASDTRRASRYYGRRLTLAECAYRQGFEIPEGWAQPLPGYTPGKWLEEEYIAIGNGVPVYMAYQFGLAAMEG